MSIPGLSHFRDLPAKLGPSGWRRWPHLSLASDQGSDMLSAIHAMLFFDDCKANVTAYYDTSHGCNRDFWNSIEEVHLKSFMLLIMLCVNLPHGPDSSDLRFQQIKDVMTKHFNECNPTTSPLFQHLCGQILREREDELQGSRSHDGEAIAWEMLRQDNIYKRKGYTCNMARFFSVVADGKDLLRRWSSFLFEVSVPAIELDMVRGSALPSIHLKVAGADEAADPDSTSSKKVSVDARTLRSCGANALVIAFAVLSESSHRRLLAIVTAIATPTMDYHARASRELRDVARSSTWLLQQLRGEVCTSAAATMRVLDDIDFLRDSRFVTAAGTLEDLTVPEVATEDELASTAGRLALSMVRCRMRRTLWMVCSYPHKFVLLLGSEEERGRCLRDFKHDGEVFAELAGLQRPSKLMTSYIERSCFKHLSVQQLQAACSEFNYGQHQDLENLVRSRFSTVMQSQGVEDMNNHQKNSRQMSNWGGRYRRPQSGLAACVRGQLLSKIHRFSLKGFS